MKSITKKGIALGIASIIIAILSSVIANCLYYIFINDSMKILELNFSKVIFNTVQIEDVRLMFIILYIAFVVIAISSMFKLFSKENYRAKTYQVTDNIEIPKPVGKHQTQHGSSWWLPSKRFSENFGVNTLDPENPTVQSLIKFGNRLKKEIEEKDKPNVKKIINKDYGQLEQIFKKGGLTVGKKDRTVFKLAFKKLGKLKLPYLKARKVEDIYYIADNLHSLTLGATRSGKTRSVVLETIENCALAGESMIMSDPKGELYEYTAVGLEKLRI